MQRFKSCFEYLNALNELLVFKHVDYNKNYKKEFDQDLSYLKKSMQIL